MQNQSVIYKLFLFQNMKIIFIQIKFIIQQKLGEIPDIRFIIVCGGTISGLGKGITTSSIALILK